MKIIFLDVDGVLNSSRTAVATGGYPWPNEYGGILWPERLDQTAIALVRKACKAADAKIVLSSTWRLGWTIDDCKRFGEALDLPIIDRTDNLAGVLPRGHEIDLWLRDKEVDAYAIIDDNSDMLTTQMPHFVKTSSDEGFGFANYLHLCSLMKVAPL